MRSCICRDSFLCTGWAFWWSNGFLFLSGAVIPEFLAYFAGLSLTYGLDTCSGVLCGFCSASARHYDDYIHDAELFFMSTLSGGKWCVPEYRYCLGIRLDHGIGDEKTCELIFLSY